MRRRILRESLAKHKGTYDMVFCDLCDARGVKHLLARDGIVVAFNVSRFEFARCSYRTWKTWPIIGKGVDIPKSRVVMLTDSRQGIPAFSHPLVYDGASWLYQFHWMLELQAARVFCTGTRVNAMLDALDQQEGATWLADVHITLLRQNK